MFNKNLTETQKAELRKCFDACNAVFAHDYFGDVLYDDNTYGKENFSVSNPCHRALCMLYVKARDMKLIPWFDVPNDAYLGYENSHKYSIYTDCEVVHNAMFSALEEYGWSFPESFNYSRYNNDEPQKLNSSVIDMLIEEQYNYEFEELEDNKDEYLKDALHHHDVVCLYHPKWNSIEIGHLELLNDVSFMFMYNQFHDLISNLTNFYNILLQNVITDGDKYYHVSLYTHIYDASYYVYDKEPCLYFHPGLIFLLHELDEVMDTLLNYINTIKKPTLD